MKSQPVKFGTKATRSTPGYSVQPEGQGQEPATVDLTAAIEGSASSYQAPPNQRVDNRYVEGERQSAAPPIGTPYQPPFDTRGDMTTVDGEQRVLDRANACMVAAQNAADRFRREHPECAGPVAGQAAGSRPQSLNVMLLWKDERNQTRSGLAYCDSRFLVTQDAAGNFSAQGNPLCVGETGTVIPPAKIFGATFRDPTPNPLFVYTPNPRDPSNPLPPAPRDCPAIPARITSQDDIDQWNRTRPAGCDPLPPFTQMCPVPSPFPTTQAEADAYSLERPQCPVIEPQAAPKKMSWLGPAALAAAAVVAVVIVTRK